MSINERETRTTRTTRTTTVTSFLKTAGKAVARGVEAWGTAIIMNQMPEVGTIFRDRRGNAWICTAYDEMRVSELRATDVTETVADNTFTWMESYEQGLTQIWPIKPCTREHVPDPTPEDLTRSFYGSGE